MQIDSLQELLPRDVHRLVAILDSNLLILLITVMVDETLLYSFKRVSGFTRQDAELLSWLLDQFSAVVTTSAALAEASNLANALTGQKRKAWFAKLQHFAVNTREAHVESVKVAEHTFFVNYGFTDTTLAILAREYVLITAEHRLSGALGQEGANAINFNNFRPLWMIPT